jgi:hypothetical protein
MAWTLEAVGIPLGVPSWVPSWLLLRATVGNLSRVLLRVMWLLQRAVARKSKSLLRGFSVNALQGLAGKTERADEGTEVWRVSLLSSVSAVGNPFGVPSRLLLIAAVGNPLGVPTWLLLRATVGNPLGVPWWLLL